MNSDFSFKKKQHPKEKASVISLATFLYIFEFIRKGRRKTIEYDDLYEVMDKFQANELGDELEKHWMDRQNKTPKNI
ncbi:hypothetical protein HHI36_005340 [Cryptolaemus montrouzieri]|uniref:Uncharacterized protein n=1 Tax=Cryptolaemus montrouzieri TaxID=559131 RepID=A0ABD2NU32_9CUCU